MPDVIATDSPYPTLLSPIRVGAVTLPNRLVMGSMHTRLETADDPMERLAAFYAERARGGAALIVTGGHAPNRAGLMEPDSPILETEAQAERLRRVTGPVRAEGARFVLQILHAGRSAKHDELVGPSEIPSAINRRRPRALAAEEIEATIEDFVRCARLARSAGFDGVEVMGSEGYLINQFTALRVNDRTDAWGGPFETRIRFPVEIVRRIRAALGLDFLLIYRISALDLVEDGATGAEIDGLAAAVEAAGCDALSTGIGWHESRIPTIAHMAPRAAWSFSVARLKRAVRVPVMVSNRINLPETAEALLADGTADLVSLARPMLADPAFLNKAAAGRADEIVPCIACNQSCLDHIFTDRIASCLVNPRAGRETELVVAPAGTRRRIAVVGAGPAGLACAVTAAGRGHDVTLFEAGDRIGGQLNLARTIPGKEEFGELVRHYATMVPRSGATLRLGTAVTADRLAADGFDHVVVATGIRPRRPDFDGADHPKAVAYPDVLSGAAAVGARVAVIGAGGIGLDVAQFLTRGPETAADFLAHWGVDPEIAAPGGLVAPVEAPPRRRVTVLQRSRGRPGARLGISTAWVLRLELARAGAEFLGGCTYERLDDAGLHLTVDGEPRVLDVDTVVICAGQEPEAGLAEALAARGLAHTTIGGAALADELNAARAIDEGTRLAARL